MSKILPIIPRLVLCYLEPLSLLAGGLGPLIDPSSFIPAQLPPSALLPGQSTPAGHHIVLPTERVLAYQCGNLYLLLMLLGLGILNTTNEPAVVHAYVWALWVADLSHMGVTAYVMGWQGALDWPRWGWVMWGNLGFVVFLCVVRSAYLMGWLGEDRISVERGKPEQRRQGKAE